MLSQKSLTGCHCKAALVISLLNQRPPVTPPAQTLFPDVAFGSQTKALVLPPTLFGPRSTHGKLVEPGIPGTKACGLAVC